MFITRFWHSFGVQSRRGRRAVLLIGMLMACMGMLYGQPSLQFVRYSTSDGLPANNFSGIVSDSDGFVWVGTTNGLARFDGHRFVALKTLQPATILPHGRVVPILIDSLRHLWASANGGLYRISLVTLKTYYYPQPYTVACTDEKGEVWFATSEGIARFDAQKNDFEQVALIVGQKKIPVRQVRKGKGNTLLVNSQAGLFRFDSRKKSFETLHALSKQAGFLFSMASDAQGMLWLSEWYNKEGGFIYYNPYEDKVIRIFGNSSPGLKNTDLNEIYPDGDEIWMATNSSGLCRYSVKEDRFHCYNIDGTDDEGLLSDQITYIHKDKFGNLWVSTTYALLQAPIGKKNAHLLAHDPHNKNSLVSTLGAVIYPLANGLMAFGTWQGLSLFDRNKKTFQNIHLPLFNNNVYNDQFVGIAGADASSFWASTWSGLYRLDNNTGKILEYYFTHINGGTNHPEALMHLQVGAIRRMYNDRKNVLWIANFDNVVWRITTNGASHKFEKLDQLTPDTSALNDKVECFLDLDERYFLLGSFDGLLKYDRQSNSFQAVQVVFPGIQAPVKITSLALSKNSDILLVANGRPFRLHLKTGRLNAVPLTEDGAIPDGDHIIEDNMGAIWITTQIGPVRLDEKTGEVSVYDAHYYLDDNVFAIRPSVAPAKDGSGNLYFGGTQGVSVLNPGDFAAHKISAPNVKIIDIKVNDQPLSTDTVIHLKKILPLSFRENNLSFSFSVLPSAIPALNRFAYRLNNGNWIGTGVTNTVNFSHLAPGRYRLEVKAANSDGAWTQSPAYLNIIIRPPWWRTGWAMLTYMLLTGAVIYGFYRFQLRQKIALREAEQLRELDAFKSRFFTNVTHEFRTPLTVILGTNDQLTTAASTGEIQGKLNLIKRNGENLLRLINQILDLAKVEAKALQLNYEQGDVLAYLRYIAESLHSLAETRSVQLHVESAASAIVMDYDPERLLHIVYNLLSNAIKFTPAGGHVTLSIFSDSKSLQIQVKDTGVGIPEEDLPYIFDRFYQARNQEKAKAMGTGIGLALTRELVVLLEGEISVTSKINHGTTFSLSLPISRKAPLANPKPSNQKHFKKAASPSHANAPHLLLIEDNPDVMEFLTDFLKDDYQLDFAFNGREGIEKALESVPDLVLSDVMMPEKDGFEVCDTLKNDERTSHIPIVLLTAKADVESRIAGLRRGADAYLAKPFHQEELRVTLANFLEQRKKWQVWFRKMALTEADMSTPAMPADGFPPDVAIEHAFLGKIRSQIEQHLGDSGFDGPNLARAMLLSEVQLYRKIKALTGKSTAIYIRSIRLHKALELLRNSSLTISEIAYDVGFEDPNYFSRTFSKEFGAAPSEMRK